VIYHSVVKPTWIWVRPLSEWNSPGKLNGEFVPRFSLLTGADAADALAETLEKQNWFYRDKIGWIRLEKPWYIFEEDTLKGEIMEYIEHMRNCPDRPERKEREY